MVENLINNSIQILENYSNIARFIDLNKARIKWSEKLNNNEKYFIDEDTTYNLFSLALSKTKSLELGIPNQVEGFLYNLDKYLAMMEGYDKETIKNYSDKLININGKHLFSALTELAIANHYRKNNFKISFFYKYYLKYNEELTKQKDFDLILDDGKNIIIVEIYMPTYTPEEKTVFSGDYDLEIDNLKNHISNKMDNKFDMKNSPQVLSIKYPLVFAINTHYDSMLQTQIYIPFKINKLYKNIEIALTDFPSVYGIMLVETDFAKKDSTLYLHKIIWNPKYAS